MPNRPVQTILVVSFPSSWKAIFNVVQAVLKVPQPKLLNRNCEPIPPPQTNTRDINTEAVIMLRVSKNLLGAQPIFPRIKHPNPTATGVEPRETSRSSSSFAQISFSSFLRFFSLWFKIGCDGSLNYDIWAAESPSWSRNAFHSAFQFLEFNWSRTSCASSFFDSHVNLWSNMTIKQFSRNLSEMCLVQQRIILYH